MVTRFRFLNLLLVLSIFLLISCGGAPPLDDESKRCVPRDLTIDTAGNGRAVIAYNPGCPGIRIMRGFYFYVSPVPLVKKYPGRDLPAEITPHNPEVYPGDPEGTATRETFEIENVANATRYYVHARALYNDKTLSLPTNEVELICYPQGEIELAVSYSGSQDGFSFANDDYCGTDDLENDIYYFHKDGDDFLCSPSRISAVNRETKIYTAAAGVIGGDLGRLKPIGYYFKKLQVVPKMALVLETADGHQAGVRVKDFEGEGAERKIILEYFYRPSVGPADSGA